MLELVNNPVITYAIVGVTMLANVINIPSSIRNVIKRILGVVWIILAFYAEYALFSEGMKKMGAATGAAGTQTIIQWSIILIIFTIVMVGLLLHGYYSVTGEYDNKE